MDRTTASNGAFRLDVECGPRGARVRLTDLAAGTLLADGPLIIRAEQRCADGALRVEEMRITAARPSAAGGPRAADRAMEVSGTLAGLEATLSFSLPADLPVLEERLVLRNGGAAAVGLERLETGFTRRITDHVGSVLPDLAGDRIVAVPLRHRPTDPSDFDVDFGPADLLRLPGREHRVNVEPLTWPQYGTVPCRSWASEGWAWTHAGRTLGVFKCNQEGMEFSLISLERVGDSIAVRFGGSGTHAGDPSALRAIPPGVTVSLGTCRYQCVDGDAVPAYLAFRRFLDENGCRFPPGFDPPVHWNELYDNPEWNIASPGRPAKSPPGGGRTRPFTYTRALLEREAEKAVRYGCQALYLDPGWDTEFGSLLWGEEWLGPRKRFVDEMRGRHGLAVSLHCPLATWMSVDGRGVPHWPRAALRAREDGSTVEGSVCMGSRQYIEEAARRMNALCDDGIAFLMFDGTWWGGGCWNPDHGHPVPFTFEDQARALLDLSRGVHERHPGVLIEMHDMIVGGTVPRYTPVYYTYGLPGSWDDNWGFELMWQPMEDIREGRARSLYWYNLGCNVPLYLHIDLRDDNLNCIVFWWYASTCRHLGIGGTHPVPEVADAQVRAMRRYRELERFYKRGEFFGMNEEIHVHALPAERAFVVNLFNPSDESRVVEGSIRVAAMGLDPDRWYVTPKGGRFDARDGTFNVKRRLAPWSAEVMEVKSLPA